MYLLMSAFHSPPWLKLIFGRRRVEILARRDQLEGVGGLMLAPELPDVGNERPLRSELRDGVMRLVMAAEREVRERPLL